LLFLLCLSVSKFVPYRILSEVCAEDKFAIKTYPTKLKSLCQKKSIEGSFKAQGLTEDDINTLDLEQHEFGFENVIWCIRPLFGDSLKSKESLIPDPARTRVLENIYYSSTGYFGNEACCTSFYTHAALLLQIPPSNQRQLSNCKRIVKNQTFPLFIILFSKLIFIFKKI